MIVNKVVRLFRCIYCWAGLGCQLLSWIPGKQHPFASQVARFRAAQDSLPCLGRPKGAVPFRAETAKASPGSLGPTKALRPLEAQVPADLGELGSGRRSGPVSVAPRPGTDDATVRTLWGAPVAGRPPRGGWAARRTAELSSEGSFSWGQERCKDLGSREM